MKDTDLPFRIPTPWATNALAGYVNPIPPVDTNGVNGYASWPEGFPPSTFVDPSEGGFPPRGQDFNGVFRDITAISQWWQAGGQFPYNADFATTIGGYPAYAVVPSARYRGLLWISFVNDNMSDPDHGGAGWQSFNRMRLTSNRTVWVDQVNGDDTNVGIEEAEAFATISRAQWLISNFIDTAGYNLYVRIKPATYIDDPILLSGTINTGIIYQAIDGTVNLNTTVHSAPIAILSGASVVLEGNGFALNATLAPDISIVTGIHVTGATLVIKSSVLYSGCRDANIYAGPAGTIIYDDGVVDKIGANSPRHWWANSGLINGPPNGNTVQLLNGTRNFSGAFAWAGANGWINVSGTNFSYSGTGTGLRFAVKSGANITGAGLTATTFPGDTTGTETGGGLYNPAF